MATLAFPGQPAITERNRCVQGVVYMGATSSDRHAFEASATDWGDQAMGKPATRGASPDPIPLPINKTPRALAKSAYAAIAGAQAKLDQANLNLGYTTIWAPIDGAVGDRSVRAGQLVQPGMSLMTVVPMGRDIYLIANFKETQIGHMTQGQAVSFTVDAFGNHEFHGNVDSFSPGTGAQFALLPPENATGNFTKIVQRVPVKIRLAGDDPLLPRLRPGLSVQATVEMRGDPAPEPRTFFGMADAR
jgi:multidrug resistance efflux pump